MELDEHKGFYTYHYFTGCSQHRDDAWNYQYGYQGKRLHVVSDIPNELTDYTFAWKDLKKIGMAISFRSELNDDKPEPEMLIRYYINSADLSAEKFSSAIRWNWSIENKLHWRLDVAMNEDNYRIRIGDAAELFSEVRHIAVNILSQNKGLKTGLRRKMLRVTMDRKYLASLLAGYGVS